MERKKTENFEKSYALEKEKEKAKHVEAKTERGRIVIMQEPLLKKQGEETIMLIDTTSMPSHWLNIMGCVKWRY